MKRPNLTAVGGLSALRDHAKASLLDTFHRTCMVTGKVYEKPLKPAVVIAQLGEQTMTIEGPCGPKVKAGMKDQAGRKVLSVVRKDVELVVQLTSQFTIISNRKTA